MADHEPDLEGGPALRTIAMPADTNPNGDIFGGWLLAQMDVAGGWRQQALFDGCFFHNAAGDFDTCQIPGTDRQFVEVAGDV